MQSTIKTDQMHNVLNVIRSIIFNLKNQPWDKNNHHELAKLITHLDNVKGISIDDYCESTSLWLK